MAPTVEAAAKMPAQVIVMTILCFPCCLKLLSVRGFSPPPGRGRGPGLPGDGDATAVDSNVHGLSPLFWVEGCGFPAVGLFVRCTLSLS